MFIFVIMIKVYDSVMVFTLYLAAASSVLSPADIEADVFEYGEKGEWRDHDDATDHGQDDRGCKRSNDL